jgi:hypothetical protein
LWRSGVGPSRVNPGGSVEGELRRVAERGGLHVSAIFQGRAGARPAPTARGRVEGELRRVAQRGGLDVSAIFQGVGGRKARPYGTGEYRGRVVADRSALVLTRRRRLRRRAGARPAPTARGNIESELR